MATILLAIPTNRVIHNCAFLNRSRIYNCGTFDK